MRSRAAARPNLTPDRVSRKNLRLLPEIRGQARPGWGARKGRMKNWAGTCRLHIRLTPAERLGSRQVNIFLNFSVVAIFDLAPRRHVTWKRPGDQGEAQTKPICASVWPEDHERYQAPLLGPHSQATPRPASTGEKRSNPDRCAGYSQASSRPAPGLLAFPGVPLVRAAASGFRSRLRVGAYAPRRRRG